MTKKKLEKLLIELFTIKNEHSEIVGNFYDILFIKYNRGAMLTRNTLAERITELLNKCTKPKKKFTKK